MTVRVLFFAVLRERLRMAETEYTVAEGSSVADLWRALCKEHPSLDEMGAGISFAVNREYVNPDHQLLPGDEVALIPPVSGG